MSVACKGKGYHLLKPGAKRRRTRQELDALKEEAELKESVEAQKSQQIFQLKAELNLVKKNTENGTNAAAILSSMLIAGDLVQDSEGLVAINETRPATKQKQSAFDTKGQ